MQHSIARELVNTATQLIKAAIETKDVSNFSVVHLSDLQGGVICFSPDEIRYQDNLTVTESLLVEGLSSDLLLTTDDDYVMFDINAGMVVSIAGWADNLITKNAPPPSDDDKNKYAGIASSMYFVVVDFPVQGPPLATTSPDGIMRINGSINKPVNTVPVVKQNILFID